MARPLTPIQADNLREKARSAIRTRIVTGEIEPDVILSARAVAAELDVSPTPVREALLDIAHEGLVEPVRNRGFRVVGLSEHDLDEIFELRVMLEPPAAARAVPLLDADRLTGLRALAERMCEHVERQDIEAFLRDDTALHLGMIEPLENARLSDQVKRLREHTRLTGLAELAKAGRLASAAAEHLSIVEAAERGDGERVESLVTRHLRHTRGEWAGRPEVTALSPPVAAGLTLSAGEGSHGSR